MSDVKIEGTAIGAMVHDVNRKLDEWKQNGKADPTLFRVIMENSDFSVCKNMMDSIMLFYHKIWTHAISPLEGEVIDLQKEIGRLILETDEHQRKSNTLQKENDSLREQVQRTSTARAEEDT